MDNNKSIKNGKYKDNKDSIDIRTIKKEWKLTLILFVLKLLFFITLNFNSNSLFMNSSSSKSRLSASSSLTSRHRQKSVQKNAKGKTPKKCVDSSLSLVSSVPTQNNAESDFSHIDPSLFK